MFLENASSIKDKLFSLYYIYILNKCKIYDVSQSDRRNLKYTHIYYMNEHVCEEEKCIYVYKGVCVCSAKWRCHLKLRALNLTKYICDIKAMYASAFARSVDIIKHDVLYLRDQPQLYVYVTTTTTTT